MSAHDEFKAIAELDLDPIKVKLMHKESGEGWSAEKADAVEFEYRRFLFLMKKYPQEQTAPLFDVDTFWHYHILDTMKYALDCETVFGYFLHHFPYIGLRGEDDEAAHQRVGERMKTLYEQEFGQPYAQGLQAWSGKPVETAWSGKPVDVAWSGKPVDVAWSGKPVDIAWSGKPVDTAWSGKPIIQAGAFYQVRPTLQKALNA
jgi:hypothetical protein